MPLTMDQYLEKARSMYDSGYNERVQAEQAAADQQVLGYDNQKVGINRNYDSAVATNTQNTELGRNNFANNELSRGMGRSSIVTTGLANLSNLGTQNENKINLERNDKLNEVESLKNSIRANLQSKLSAMKSDYSTGLNNTAMQLFQRDQDYERQVALAKKSSSGSRSSGSSSKSTKLTTEQKQAAMDGIMNDFSLWSQGLLKGSNGNMDRAGQSDMLKWIYNNQPSITAAGLNVSDVEKAVKSTYRWDKDSSGNWVNLDE